MSISIGTPRNDIQGKSSARTLENLLTGQISKSQKYEKFSWHSVGYFILKYIPKFFLLLDESTKSLINRISTMDSFTEKLNITAHKIAKRLNKTNFERKMPSRINDLIQVSKALAKLEGVNFPTSIPLIIETIAKMVEKNSTNIFGWHIDVKNMDIFKAKLQETLSPTLIETAQKDPEAPLIDGANGERAYPTPEWFRLNETAQKDPETFLKYFASSEEISPTLVAVFIANFEALFKAKQTMTASVLTNNYEKLFPLNQTGIAVRFLRNFDKISSEFPEKAVSLFLGNFDALYSIFPKETVSAFLQNTGKLLTQSKEATNKLFLNKLAKFLEKEPRETAELFLRNFSELEKTLPEETYKAF